MYTTVCTSMVWSPQMSIIDRRLELGVGNIEILASEVNN